MSKIPQLIAALESHIAQQAVTNTAVSSSSVGWHIEHSLLVINGVLQTLASSNPADYKWSFSFPRLVVLMSGKIPRGKGKAPSVTVPREASDAAALQNRVAKVGEKVALLGDLSPKHNFKHPYFGLLDAAQTIKFLEIHTQHHLNIIKDILVVR
jgi:DinB superfamily